MRSSQAQGALTGCVRYVLPPLVGLLFVAPMIWLVSQSLKQPGVPPQPTIELIPSPFSISNYAEVFRQFPLAVALWNSLLVCLIAVFFTLITASFAGFAMALLSHVTRRRLLVFSIALMCVPVPGLWLPRYIIFAKLGLIDSHFALIFPSLMASSPFFVLVFYWSFRRIPSAIYDSARLDGAGIFQVWRRIAMPLSRPAIAVITVLTFTLYWNDYLSPLMYLRSIPKYTLSLRLQMFQGGDVTLLPLSMAGVVIGIVPVVIMFLLVQRYFWPEGRLSESFIH